MIKFSRSTKSKKKSFFQKWGWTILLVALCAALAFMNVWKLSSLPAGFFTDETAIGHNAASIMETAKDEYGTTLPLFFRSFNDYKSSLYVYVMTGVFRVGGISGFTLRLTSVLFHALFVALMTMLAVTLYPKKRSLVPYAIVAAAMLPWLFVVSRIGFEVNAQPAMIAAMLLCFVRMEGSAKRKIVYAILTGIFAGLIIYSYATGRVLGPLFALVLAAALLMKGKTYRMPLLAFCATFVVFFVPFAWFYATHPELAERFKGMSVFGSSTPIIESLKTFGLNYISHFSADFLLFKGDVNSRHAIGFGGEIFIVVFVLAVLGLIARFSTKKSARDPFTLALLLCLLVSPIASSLTTDSVPHALRSIPLAVFILIFSLEGFVLLTDNEKTKRILLIAIFGMLAFESGTFAYRYFVNYPEKSRGAFDNYGFEEALRDAVAEHPRFIDIAPSINYTAADFFKRTLTDVPSDFRRDGGDPESFGCFIYKDKDERKYRADDLRWTNIGLGNGVVRGRCFGDRR
jgi:4-amino-4-deoxy-L-arabinose transferase-like glycosyltransferase